MTGQTEALRGVAIVGASTRVPGAATVAALWANLTGGVESVSFFTRDELAAAGVPARMLDHPAFVPAASVLAHVDRFDAAFFGLTPREAALLDPQARLFMECAWEAIEHAGYAPASFEGPIGVFGGVGATRYFIRHVLPSADALEHAGAYQAMIANDKDFVPTWVSYKLNLRGPSVAVQTACSTSLVAVHLACQSLLTFECDMAIAGGVSLSLDAASGYLYQDGGILSPDGHCRPFDARAKGTVHGSGAGMVALRRIEDAIAAGDTIIAVIRGSAVNNDGAVRVGFTAPGIDGQTNVIGLAHAVADVPADSIGFVEAHGTGTPLGDPVEVAALTRVFRRQTTGRQFCALGSVKSNLGHLDAAAGVTGLIKAALAVHHGQVPPTVHFVEPNPQLDLTNSPFFVNNTTQPWPIDAQPRRAAVSSFGIGGTNAHAILEAAPAMRASGPSRRAQIIALSAKSTSALDAMTDRLADALDVTTPPAVADAAFTLAVGRTSFAHRRVIVATGLYGEASTVDDVLDAIDARNPAAVFTGVAPETTRPVTFMFPGQGSQHVEMARALYEREPVFREALTHAVDVVRSLQGPDLLPLLYPTSQERERAAARLAETDTCQIALFVVEHALAQLWLASGVTPQSAIGHSVGEYVAACLSGVFSLPEAIRAVLARGRLMAAMPRGEMLAVSAAEADVKRWIDVTRVSIAVVNHAAACVVAGPTDEIVALAAALDERGVLHRRLEVSHAFHSHMMDAALPPFRDVMRTITLRAPTLPFISNVTGTWIRAEEATDPEYWVRQMRRTVYFADGLREVLRDPQRIVLEVGPGRTLQALALQQRGPGASQEALATLPDARDTRPADESFVGTVARLWLAGGTVTWPKYYSGEIRNRVPLPTYPFERERHWIEKTTTATTSNDDDPQPFEAWFSSPVWTQAPRAHTETPRGPWAIVTGPGRQDDEIADGVVAALHARGVAASRISAAEVDASVEHVMLCATTFAEALPVVQAMSRATEPRSLVVVQRGVQQVTGEDPIIPERAAVLGLWRVAPQEAPHLQCAHIDLPLAITHDHTLWLAEALAEDLCGVPMAVPIAYRGRMRWAERYEPVAITGEPSRFVAGGVYWITGGTGGIGLALAEHLARTVRARLILTSRTGRIGERARLALEAAGAEVLVMAADVTDSTAMTRVADAIAQRFGRLDGVVHAAGIAGGRVAALETTDGAARVMAPKVTGAAVLEQVVARFAPALVVYCSSLSVELGGVGQAAYAGGNAVLNAWARQPASGSRHTVAINWDQWRDIGMAAAVADPEAIGSSDGTRAFTILSGLGRTHVAVSTRPLAGRQRVRASVVSTGVRSARPALATDYVRPDTAAEAALADLWQELLGLEAVGVNDNLFELGGDSLTALRMLALYRERTGISVPVTTVYGAPTIRTFLAAKNQASK